MSEVQKYEPYKIPPKKSLHESNSGLFSADFNSSKRATDSNVSFDEPFAEIEINEDKVSLYKSAPIPQPAYPVFDKKRQIFKAMREIAWNNHSSYVYNLKFYNKNTQHENSRVFYRQAVFMKDFEDDYDKSVPFSSYYPYYQLMNYEQLRTYFTWRTNVRRGIIENTSLSYAFVYVYELLNNIGVNDPHDGLNKLMIFRKAFKKYDATIDKYLVRWIKDYHVYYQLADSFKDFIYEYNLEGHFPEILEYEPDLSCDFENLSGLSKYNIRKSAFYNDKTGPLIKECFEFVIRRIKEIFADIGIDLYSFIFQTSNKKSVWNPFKGALFYPSLKQPSKKIVLSNSEVYICSQNTWYLSVLEATDSGKQLLTYIFKKLEAVLRKVTGYKYKLSVKADSIDGELLQVLNKKGISLEKAVTDAVVDFYREKNKKIVTVDPNSLNRIRLEAQYTQEKLIVPDDEPLVSVYASALSEEVKQEKTPASSDGPSHADDLSALTERLTDASQFTLSGGQPQDNQSVLPKSPEFTSSNNLPWSLTPDNHTASSGDLTHAFTHSDPSLSEDFAGVSKSAAAEVKPLNKSAATNNQPATSSPADGWTNLRQALTDVEISALSAVLQGNHNMKQFADEHGIMLELLADSINEKAFDHIGDSILELDDSMNIYDEYLENVKAMVIEA